MSTYVMSSVGLPQARDRFLCQLNDVAVCGCVERKLWIGQARETSEDGHLLMNQWPWYPSFMSAYTGVLDAQLLSQAFLSFTHFWCLRLRAASLSCTTTGRRTFCRRDFRYLPIRPRINSTLSLSSFLYSHRNTSRTVTSGGEQKNQWTRT